jgi:hypothetical protein
MLSSIVENTIIPTYYKPKMASYMSDYRAKMSEEQRDKIREYQREAMRKRRQQERAEKLAKGITTKIGRPKKRTDMTPAEMKARIAELEQLVSIHNSTLS